jgi:hypothetical protein
MWSVKKKLNTHIHVTFLVTEAEVCTAHKDVLTVFLLYHLPAASLEHCSSHIRYARAHKHVCLCMCVACVRCAWSFPHTSYSSATPLPRRSEWCKNV